MIFATCYVCLVVNAALVLNEPNYFSWKIRFAENLVHSDPEFGCAQFCVQNSDSCVSSGTSPTKQRFQ